jgi:choline dehydrogenase
MKVVILFTLFILVTQAQLLLQDRLYNAYNSPYRTITNNTAYDYIVVGGGTAGSILAKRLTETTSNNKKYTVLVLEAGSSDSDIAQQVPAFNTFTTRNNQESYTWNYKTIPQTNLMNRQVDLIKAKALGGTTSIHHMIYNRGNAQDYNNWISQGSNDWTWSSTLPFFKKSEGNTRTNIDAQYHGTTGEIKVSDSTSITNASKYMLQAFNQYGIATSTDHSNGRPTGVAINQVHVSNGERQSVADAFLTSTVLARSNLYIRINSLVKRILFDNDKRTAKGVIFKDTITGQVYNVTANKEIILSAGAVNTPWILLQSGIGPESQLRDAKIAVIKNVPGVGANFRDAITVPVQVEVNNNVDSLDDVLHTFSLYSNMTQWIKTRTGTLTSNMQELAALYKTTLQVTNTSDLQFLFTPASLEYVYSKRMITLSIVLLQAQSSGAITLNIKNPEAAPIIDPGYLKYSMDLQRLYEGVKVARQVLSQPSIKSKWIREWYPGELVQAEQGIKNYIKKYATSGMYPCCSAKMGTSNDVLAVVDSSLRVIGLNKLRIVDASVMPSMTSSNCCATSMMIAERGANLILK